MVLKLTTVNIYDVKSVVLDLLHIYRRVTLSHFNMRFTGFLGVTRKNSLSLAIQHSIYGVACQIFEII